MVAWADSREKSALMNHLGLVFRMSNERALGVKSYQYKERVTTVFNGYHRPLVDKNLVSQDRKASSISRSGLFFHFPPCLSRTVLPQAWSKRLQHLYSASAWLHVPTLRYKVGFLWVPNNPSLSSFMGLNSA